MTSFQSLTSLSLRQLSELLAAHTPDPALLGPNEWLGVVQLLTQRLTKQPDLLTQEDWARSTAALDYVFHAAITSGAIDNNEVVIRRINLSAALLQVVSPSVEIDILNPDATIELLLRKIPMSVDEARRLVVNWRSLEIAKIRQLRLIKNLLSPALLIKRTLPEHKFDTQLTAWESIFPSLP
jgi:hypothetical protein